MSTRYYGLPTVDDSATMTFVDSVNGLANSTDAVLHGVAESFDKQAFDLPTATSETLGGVRIGDGFKVYSDGLLTTSSEKFTLSPAKETSIGGVAIGKNVTVTDAGAIGVGDGAFSTGEIAGAQLAAGAVTTNKLANYAVEAPSQISTDLYNKLTSFNSMWRKVHTLGYDFHGYTEFASVYKMGDLMAIVPISKLSQRSGSSLQVYVDNIETLATYSNLGTENAYFSYITFGKNVAGPRSFVYFKIAADGTTYGIETKLNTDTEASGLYSLVSPFKI